MKKNKNQRRSLSPGKRKQIDPLEKAIGAALSPGSFISYNASWSFVDDMLFRLVNLVGVIIFQPFFDGGFFIFWLSDEERTCWEEAWRDIGGFISS